MTSHDESCEFSRTKVTGDTSTSFFAFSLSPLGIHLPFDGLIALIYLSIIFFLPTYALYVDRVGVQEIRWVSHWLPHRIFALEFSRESSWDSQLYLLTSTTPTLCRLPQTMSSLLFYIPLCCRHVRDNCAKYHTCSSVPAKLVTMAIVNT